MANVGYKITLNRLPELIKQLPVAAQAGTDLVADDIAAQEIATGHQRTGSMITSVYVKSPKGSEYALRAAEAMTLNPAVEIEPEAPNPSGQVWTQVGVAAHHGIYEEERPGHEWVAPAVAHVAPIAGALAAEAFAKVLK